ncbi:MAG: hypothetical protein ACXW0Z_06560 [Gemmatirosa sp.]
MIQRTTRVSRRRLPVFALAAVVMLGALPACGPRQVQVSTGEARAPESSIEFTNNLAQAVNVYVRVSSGAELFLRQVGARTTESIPVRGIAAGTAVTLRAAPVDGSVSYAQENVVLGRGVAWRVP